MDGEFREVKILDSLKINNFFCCKIEIYDDEPSISKVGEKKVYWVIKKLLKDLRPIISHKMKKYFDIPTLPFIKTKIKGRTYQLFFISDPSPCEEKNKKIVTLTQFLKKEPLTDDLIKQAKRIYLFRQIFQIKTVNDSDIIVIQENYRNVLYSINEPMENINEKVYGYYLSDFILNKWFKDDINLYVKKYLCKFISKKSTMCVSEMAFAIDELEQKLTQTIKELDKNYIWYVSAIINEQILFCSK